MKKIGSKIVVFAIFSAFSALIFIVWALLIRSNGVPCPSRKAQDSHLRQAKARPTAAQLREKALARLPSQAPVEAVNPFVITLGPGATSYAGGMAALRALPAILSSNQVSTLRAAVAAPYSPSCPFSPLEFNGIKNVAADILLQQPEFPPDFLADLALQHGDPAQDEVWRDYCLQMLASGYMNLAGRAESDPEAPAARELALGMLMDAASAGGNTWPGTALLGLNTILAAEPSAFPREELDRRILAVISDASASEAALITASRLAGMARLDSSRPALAALARDSASGLVRDAAAKSLAELPPETL